MSFYRNKVSKKVRAECFLLVDEFLWSLNLINTAKVYASDSGIVRRQDFPFSKTLAQRIWGKRDPPLISLFNYTFQYEEARNQDRRKVAETEKRKKEAIRAHRLRKVQKWFYPKGHQLDASCKAQCRRGNVQEEEDDGMFRLKPEDTLRPNRYAFGMPPKKTFARPSRPLKAPRNLREIEIMRSIREENQSSYLNRPPRQTHLWKHVDLPEDIDEENVDVEDCNEEDANEEDVNEEEDEEVELEVTLDEEPEEEFEDEELPNIEITITSATPPRELECESSQQINKNLLSPNYKPPNCKPPSYRAPSVVKSTAKYMKYFGPQPGRT